MNYFLKISLGLFLALIFKGIKQRDVHTKAAALVMVLLMVIMLPMQAAFNSAEETIDIKTLVIEYILMIAGVIVGLAFEKYCLHIKEWLLRYDRPFRSLNIFENQCFEGESEEDYMKTKYGKIMTIICILLVIYMFVSAFCMYKLNQKINSVYTITQEMQDK